MKATCIKTFIIFLTFGAFAAPSVASYSHVANHLLCSNYLLAKDAKNTVYINSFKINSLPYKKEGKKESPVRSRTNQFYNLTSLGIKVTVDQYNLHEDNRVEIRAVSADGCTDASARGLVVRTTNNQIKEVQPASRSVLLKSKLFSGDMLIINCEQQYDSSKNPEVYPIL